MTKQDTKSQLLPEPLAKAAGPEVLEARDRAAGMLQARAEAIEARRAAAIALAGADAEDAEAMGAAIQAGKPNPKPSKAEREREFEDAVDRENKANELAVAAADHYRRVLAKHGDALAREQRPRFEREGDKLAALLAQLQEQLAQYAYEGGLLRSLASPRADGTAAADRREMLGRAPVPELPRFDPLVMPSLAELHEAVGRLAWSAFPMRSRILEAVGKGPTTWDAVVQKLGVRPNDYQAIEVRQHLTADQTLAWVDQEGNRLESGDPFGYLSGPRFLAPVTERRLSEVEQARQIAAERQAA